MADDFFGPASDLAVTARPVLAPATARAGHARTWFKPCSSAGAADGTLLAAEFLNHLIANIDQVRIRAGLDAGDVAATSDDILVESILALIDGAGGGSGSGLTEEQVRDLVAGFIVPAGLLTKTHDDAGNKLTLAVPADAFCLPGVLAALTVVTASKTWEPADGATRALVLAAGGGGAGGGVPTVSNNVASCGGGAGEVRILHLSSLAASYAIEIGAGGKGKTNATGGDGGETRIRQGATTRLAAKGGKGGSTWATNVAGAAGTGGSGGFGLGATRGEKVFVGDVVVGGAGGGNLFGPGAPSSPSMADGVAATTPGGGGGGANGMINIAGLTGKGGDGFRGVVVILEYR